MYKTKKGENFLNLNYAVSKRKERYKSKKEISSHRV